MSLKNRRRVVRLGNDVVVHWRGEEFRSNVFREADAIAYNQARAVSATAAQNIASRRKSKPRKNRRRLHNQISTMRSKFEGGGAVSWAQAPGRWFPPYHASFVELGSVHNKRPMRYMRDAADTNAGATHSKFREMLNRNIKSINRKAADELRF